MAQVTGRLAEPPRPAATASAGRSSLPKPLTSFIGRERELAEAKQLLQGSYLVTLTGPGGSGKTRLGIALAAEVAADYPDGVFFVPLAPVRDPGLVPSTIAQGIGLQDARDRPLMEHLISQLRERRLLIVLDNFEHLLAGAPVVTQLLQETSALRILVTSRSSLRISGEQECPVPPLALPSPASSSTPDSVARCESVRLFAARAAAATPGFVIDERNASAIAQITCRLDGLPLAIELAAARVKLLPPESILARLEHSLSLLTGGSRDLPDRQQTLRATIAWSYQLLTDGAKRLLAVCSVFAGGATMELIETVCDGAIDIGLPVLDGLQELADQSLLRQRTPGPGPARYTMLETIREYAAEHLDLLPEADRVRGAHAAAFLALAESAGRPQAGLARKEWLERLDSEHNNVRAALGWFRQHDPPAALRLSAAMSAFWSLRGHHTEGRERLADLLGLVTGGSTARVTALNGAGWLAIDQGDYTQADRLLGESIGISQAEPDLLGEGMATVYLGRSQLSRMRVAAAGPLIERAVTLLADSGDQAAVAFSLLYSGLLAQFSGRLEAACGLFARCAALSAGLGLEPLSARAKQTLGCALVDLGDLAAARAALGDGLPGSLAVGDRWMVPLGLAGFAGHAAKTGRPRLALKLSGAADAYQEANEFSMPAPIREMVDRWLSPVHRSLGPAAARLIAAGRRLGPEEAVSLALANEPEDAAGPGPRRTLTRREREVAVLVAGGLTNRDIAAELFLSVRTVEVHVDHIFSKLGFHTRTQLAAWAYEEGLLPEDT
jgi:predicted ATPase/DNA-binding CsgD family transcriptional regulator